MKTKFCYVCKQHHPLSEFGKNKSKKDGLQDECKPCRTISHKLYARRVAEAKREAISKLKDQLIDEVIHENASAVVEALGE